MVNKRVWKEILRRCYARHYGRFMTGVPNSGAKVKCMGSPSALEAFLEQLRRCPPRQLKHRFGIYDNFTIAFNGSHTALLRDLRSSAMNGKFSLTYTPVDDGGTFMSQGVSLEMSKQQVYRYAYVAEGWDGKHENTAYGNALVMHPGLPPSSQHLNDPSMRQHMADMTIDLCSYLMDQEYEICLPRAFEWERRPTPDDIITWTPACAPLAHR